MVKLNFQLRVFNGLGPLVLLIAQCVKDTRDFLLYLLIWIVFFVQVNLILGAHSGEELDGMTLLAYSRSTSNYVNMFRSSIGDLQDPQFTENDGTYLPIVIWFAFIVMIYFMPVILNNFLIAKVSSSYENFLNTAVLSKFKNKIHFVKEYLCYQNFIQNYCYG